MQPIQHYCLNILFLIVDIQVILHMLPMFVFTKSCMSSLNSSLVITVRPNTKEYFHLGHHVAILCSIKKSVM
jgi:NADH:ubiquinone oxidoreductase subunit 3 (subunit A)